jgi:hypothetical protein
MRTLSRSSILLLSAASHIVCCLAILIPGFHTQLHAQAYEQTAVLPKDKTVIEMSVEELLQYYHSELRHLEFSPNQDPLDMLLEKTGERVQAFFRDFSDTSSKEYLLLQKLRYNGGVDYSITRDFNYLITYHPGEKKPVLEEYRTDKKNRPVDQNAIPGFVITAGYACLGLSFHPSYQPGLRFRYLGRQASDARAHLIAFAQKFDVDDLHIEYTDAKSGKAIRLPVQGIAWIDPATYQILRIRINLVPAGNRSPISEQTTDVQFSEVRMEGVPKQLWLPSEVLVTTKIARQAFRSLHQYSGYRLFSVQSDYKIDQPKSRD